MSVQPLLFCETAALTASGSANMPTTKRPIRILLFIRTPFRIPRMNSELAWMVAIFWMGRKLRCEVSMASAFPDCPNFLNRHALLQFVGLEQTTIGRLTRALVVAAAPVSIAAHTAHASLTAVVVGPGAPVVVERPAASLPVWICFGLRTLPPGLTERRSIVHSQACRSPRVADDVRLSENLLVICFRSSCERTYV